MDHSVGSVDNDADEAVATAVEKTLSATMGAKRTINQSQSTKSRRKQKPSELQTCFNIMFSASKLYRTVHGDFMTLKCTVTVLTTRRSSTVEYITPTFSLRDGCPVSVS